MTITSEQARAMIPDYTQHDICVQLRRSGGESGVLAEKTMWLVYLCAKGDIYSVKDFIQSTELTELRAILNKKLYENWDGTVLHTVLYWNTGNKAVDLFQLLIEHGADPVRDYYGVFPWENKAPLWILPFNSIDRYGRDVDEFEETYQYLCEIYGEEPESNQNASPIAAPILDDELENIANRLFNTHVARRLNFDIDDEIAAEDEEDYSDMPALVSSDEVDYSDMPPLEYFGAPRTVSSMKSPFTELLLTNYSDMLERFGASDYSDMPALVGSDDDEDYSDMPELVDSDDEDEYADMPPLEYVGGWSQM